MWTLSSAGPRVLAALWHWLDEPPMMSPRCVVRAFLPLLLVALPSGAARAQTPGPLATSAAPALVDVRGHEDRGDRGDGAERRFRHPAGDDDLERGKQDADALPPSAAVPGTGGSGPEIATPGLGWDGISKGESFCGCLPPDGAIAAGPNNLVVVVNTALKVFTKTGTLLAGPINLASFLARGSSLTIATDPFADYDPVANRFMLGALFRDLSYNSAVNIAVSGSGDPTATWYVYSFPVAGANNLLDFPHATNGPGAIYLAGNVFASGLLFTGARVYAYDKSAMYAGAVASFTYWDVGLNAAGNPGDTLSPAHGVTGAPAMYFISADNFYCSKCSTISVFKWSDPFGLSSFTLQGGVSVTPYGQPPNAPELGGGTVVTNDARNLETYWSNGTLYGAHAIGFNPGSGTVASAQWYQIGTLDTAPALVQEGIVASNGQHRYFPTIAVDGSGDAFLAYSYSSSSDYVGIRYTARLANDPLGTMTQPETVMKAGEANANGSRWGDYGIAVSDGSGTIWNFLEYAKAGSLWGTWVGSVSLMSPAPDFTIGATPASRTVVAGAGTTYSVAITGLDGYSNAVTLSVTSVLPAGVSASFGPNPVAPGGSSTLTVSTTGTTSAGSYPITIKGADPSGSPSHTTSVTLVVAVPDFTIDVTPTAETRNQGAAASYTVTIGALNRFTGTVGLSVSGEPLDSISTVSFSPPSVSGSGTSTLSLTTFTSGTYSLVITGTSGALGHSKTVTLTVPTPNFTLTASPTFQSVSRGARQPANYTITVTPTGGFSGAVSFSVSGVPGGGTTAVFVLNPATGRTTLTVTPTLRTPRGTYGLTIRGTNGALSHTASVTLRVTR